MSTHDHVPDRGPALFIVNTVGAILAGISCILRCYVRVRILKSFGLDDWLILLSTVTFITYVTLSNIGVNHGTGRHRGDLDPEENKKALHAWFYCYIFYAITMISVKLSIATFLLRVTVKRVHQWIIHSASIVTIISCLTFIFVVIFECHPINYFWNKYTTDKPGSCLKLEIMLSLSYIYSIASIMSDFTYALLPAWVVSHLNMARNTKIGLMFLMGMGCVASAAVAARMPYLQYMNSDDFLWDTTYMAIWSSVEQALAITAGCLATLQPLIKLVGEKLGILPSQRTTTAASGHASRSSPSRLGGPIGGQISVKKTFSRKTEMYSLNEGSGSDEQQDGSLRLQPRPSGYKAMCYNTSQEELRPTQFKENESKDDMTISSVKAREIP
ncbi:hypothetical protein QBC42DRAFT_278750 [Cladorrhinum samala]|uniref:Rhodopsin domain-containing protein n=1 Tax=Cladorrhinum samala TaxID=585594 RepID=A0AAV9HAH1_9PEZI|nr:hypothetical protein QBC42DRAFT_278750 [Cladorrhinum samala]